MLRPWAAGLAGFWDAAIKGSGAAQAALVRALMHDVSYEMGVAALSCCIDIGKLFGSAGPVSVVQCMRALSFPPLPLLLHLQAHWCPRLVRAGEAVAAEAILVTRCLLAGCVSSCDLARGLLYAALQDELHRTPPVVLGSYVGGLHVGGYGAEDVVVRRVAWGPAY